MLAGQGCSKEEVTNSCEFQAEGGCATKGVGTREYESQSAGTNGSRKQYPMAVAGSFL